MKKLQTYEGFFSNLFGKKDDSKSIKSKDVKSKKNSFFNLNLFSKKDDDFATKVYNSLKSTIESSSSQDSDKSSKVLGDIIRYGDYKRKVQFKSNGNTYNISIEKSSSKIRTTSKILLSPSERYVLVINNRHFIDQKTGAPTVSQSICKKIWHLLDKEQQKRGFDKEKIEKDFE
jgi:hypothetical protein